jgi:hypothetical protein
MAYLESVIIRDTGGTEADVTAANALKVDGSAVTQPVNIVAGSVTANVELQQDVFGQLVIANRYNQFEINYDSTDPDSITDITVTKTSGGDASNSAGQAVFTSNANTNGGVKAVTNLTVTYRPNAETYAAFTAIWPSGGLANSHQRIGIYDASNGFFIGYEGTAFGITLRKGGVDTFTAKASWNIDTLTGAVGSKYTRNGVPEAIDFTKDNLFRIRYGWLGAAPIYWEVLSPDGEWVLFDIYRHPNTTGGTTINNPDLPMTLDIQKTAAGATVLTMNTACWAAGTTSPYTKISSTITDNTLANMSRSVITGRSSTGGGTYYNVKVNPSGSLVTTADFAFAEDSAHASGDTGAFVMGVRNDSNTAMTSANGDYSPIAVNANGAVAINDGGNSVTVDAPVATPVNVQIGDGTDTADVIPLTSNDALAVAIVDGSGNQVTSFGGGVQYQEDTPHTTGDTGTMSLAVRNDDAGTAFTGTNGDYSPIAVDSRGQVFVNTASGNSLNVNVTGLPNEGQQTMANSISVAIASDQSAVPVSGTVAATQSGAWNVGVNNGAGAAAVNIQDGGNSITIDGTVSANINVSYSEDTAHSSGDRGAFVLGIRNDDQSSILTGTNGDYSGISVDDRGRIATVGGQSVNLPHVGGAQTMGAVDNITGNVLVTNIYDLANNDALVVGLVDGNGDLVPADKLATNTTVEAPQRVEDDPHTTGDKGVFVLAVRNDTNAVVTSADGDYSQISVNDKGAIAIQDGGNSITVDGTVAVSSIVPGTGATDLGKAEDSAHASGDVGVMTLGVRNDNGSTSFSGSNGDYTPLAVDQYGKQFSVSERVHNTNHTAADIGTFILSVRNDGAANQAATLNNTYASISVDEYGKMFHADNKAEDAAHTSGDQGSFILGVRNDSNAVMTSADGDYSPIAVNSNGAVAINDGGNSITVDGTVGVSGTVTVSGTVAATQSGTWVLGANSGVDIGDVTVNNAGGASAVNIQDGGNSITVDGTVAATQSGTWNVVAAGDVAHDSPDSGNPVKIGFQAETALPAAVANGDRTNGISDQFGRQLVTHISPGMQTWKSANYTTTQTGVAVWTPASGKTIAVTYLAVSSYATTTGRVIVWFGASGDTTYTAGTDQLVWAGSFAPGTSSKPGAILNFPTPVFSANVDYILRVTTDANISLDVSVYGYEF